jgi:hypothetical protein
VFLVCLRQLRVLKVRVGVPIDGLALLAGRGLVAALGNKVALHIVKTAKVVPLHLAELKEVAGERHAYRTQRERDRERQYMCVCVCV